MKKIHFIAQAKGGVGKSLLMYLFALKFGHDPSVYFIDLDSSTQTSKNQLKFLAASNMEVVQLSNDKDVLVRDRLISYLELVSVSEFDQFFFDLGSPESAQLPALLRYDVPMKEFADMLGLEMIFHIVMAGGSAYVPSGQYLDQIGEVAKDFQINVWKSVTSFRKYPELSKELEAYCQTANYPLYKFGDFEPESDLGGQILDGARRGFKLSDHQIGAMLRLRNELQNLYAL
ncbi:MAG TPA: hypothetical protein VGN64_21665 [Dyadobacter sp.]|nr:hypothetical protein [Dyadobacter sp.]